MSGAISSKVLPKKKKGYKPRSSAYITPDKVQEIIGSEPPRHALCIKILFSLGLRASEVIGKYGEYEKRPGIRPIDIDAELHADWGCNHTIRVWRKRGKFKVLPLKDQLYDELKAQIKEYNIKPEERIFSYHRTAVYGWLSKYGRCVDTRYRIGIHTLRRSFGKNYRARGGKMEDLQKIYSHENMQQTMQYIGEDESTAMSNFAKIEMGFQCKICYEIFESQTDMTKHEKLHTGKMEAGK